MQTIHPKVHREGSRRDGGFMATTRRSGPSKLLGQSLRRERFPQRALVRRQEERVKEAGKPARQRTQRLVGVGEQVAHEVVDQRKVVGRLDHAPQPLGGACRILQVQPGALFLHTVGQLRFRRPAGTWRGKGLCEDPGDLRLCFTHWLDVVNRPTRRRRDCHETRVLSSRTCRTSCALRSYGTVRILRGGWLL